MASSDVRYVYQIDMVDNTKKQFQSVQRNMQKTQVAAGEMNRHFRQWRGMAGQMGHQLQDIAVQAQAGTNSMIIMAQQGGQIASLIGPYGAIAGAFIAIAGAAVMASDSFGDMRSASDKLADAQDKLNDILDEGRDSVFGFSKELKELHAVSEAVAELKIQTAILEAEESIGSAFEGMRTILDEGTSQWFDFSDEVGGAIDLLILRNQTLQQALDSRAAGDLGAKAYLRLLSAQEELSEEMGISAENAETLMNLFAGLDEDAPVETIDELAKTIASFKGNEAFAAFRGEIVGIASSALTTQAKLEALLRVATTGFDITPVEEFSEELDGAFVRILANQEAAAKKHYDGLIQGQKDRLDSEKRLLEEAEKQQGLGLFVEIQANNAKRAMQDLISSEEEAHQIRIDRVALFNDVQLNNAKRSMQDLISVEEESYQERQDKKQLFLDIQAAAAKRNFQDMANDHDDYLDGVAEKEQKQRELQLMSIGFAQQGVSALQGVLEEGTDAHKAAFAAQKALAVASIIVNTHEAASKAANAAAPAGPFAWFATEAGIKAMGYASAGIVAGTALASFEGGGITFNGIRAGGVDGKGGRMAVVHPNEKITDLEKDGHGGGSVNVTFQLQAIDTQSGMEFIMKNRDILTNAVSRSMNNRGRRL